MIRWVWPLLVVALAGFAYGRFVLAAGTDPLVAVRGPFLIVYLVSPLLGLLAVVHAAHHVEPAVLIRSRSVMRWWWDRVHHGALTGLSCAGVATVACLVARFGAPVPSIDAVAVTALTLGAVVGLQGALIFGVAALLSLMMGRVPAAFGVVLLWVGILLIGRSDSPVNVWAQAQTIITAPATGLHLVWPVLAVAAATATAVRYRRGWRPQWLRPALLYAAAAALVAAAQAFVGYPVATEDGVTAWIIDPVRQVLGGVTRGTDLRTVLFMIIVNLGYAVGFAAHLARHRDGAWRWEVLRHGSVQRWYAHHLRPWLLAAPLVPLGCAVTALAANALQPSPISNLGPVELGAGVLTGTAQLAIYCIGVTVIQHATSSPTALTWLFAGIAAATYARSLGLALPGIAANHLPKPFETSIIGAALIGQLAVLTALLLLLIILVRIRPLERSTPE